MIRRSICSRRIIWPFVYGALGAAPILSLLTYSTPAPTFGESGSRAKPTALLSADGASLSNVYFIYVYDNDEKTVDEHEARRFRRRLQNDSYYESIAQKVLVGYDLAACDTVTSGQVCDFIEITETRYGNNRFTLEMSIWSGQEGLDEEHDDSRTENCPMEIGDRHDVRECWNDHIDDLMSLVRDHDRKH